MSDNPRDPNPGEDSSEELQAEAMAAYEPLPLDPLAEVEDDAETTGFETDPIIEEKKDEVSLPRPEEPDSVRLSRLREKAKTLPTSPGVYLMKDTRGVVIYVGKSRSLRDRVGSYFVPSTDLGTYGKQLLLEFVAEFDTLACESEVEALLVENRLIKDIQPRFNARLLDDKTYPYLEITTRDDYPGVYITRQPSGTGTKLYGPFTSVTALKEATQHLQRVFKFRTCHLEILEEDPKKKFFRPCLLYAIRQCTAPCADKISREAYRQDIDRLKRFLDSKGSEVLREMTGEMEEAAKTLQFEKAATLRDQIKALRALSERSSISTNKSIQAEVFFQDHRAGLKSLQETLDLPEPIRSIEGIDIAHFQGEATVGSLVCFIDGRPFKNGYRRFRIKTVTGVDDYKSIQEVVSRRYRDAGTNQELYPDVILIDGGLGQLHAAQAAFEQMDVRPPMVISLAKREEEVFVQARKGPIKLSRTNAGLKLLQHIRDEAHRFGQSYHHLLISKKRFEQEVATGKRPPKSSRKKKVNPAVPASERAAAEGEFKVLTVDQIKEKSRELGASGRIPPDEPPKAPQPPEAGDQISPTSP
ncbi:MAG TPA: excinuclease ABC subunit UvrC [Phycisphaerae bacterium]|nr:excinuclease ABC subunit UvrC [Phycisphaerae bacterium]